MLSANDIKKLLGQHASTLVKNGDRFGLGTGTTVYWLIEELAIRVKAGEKFLIVPTSEQTRELALARGIQVTELNEVDQLDYTIDGADEIDHHLNLVKGGGGALLQEKMVAAASKKMIVIADAAKYVEHLGKFPLPLEVIPSGWKHVQRKLTVLGCDSSSIRNKEGKDFRSDNNNLILDCNFGKITDPAQLNLDIHLIPGVVETGLFIKMASKVILADHAGEIIVRNKQSQ